VIVAERLPLLSGLSWEGLLVTEGLALPRQAGDEPLLWQGERPLIFCRQEQLVIGFDPVHSNATRLPAFIVLLHRFIEELRARLPLPEAGNFELHQPLALPPRQQPPEWSVTTGAPPQTIPLPPLQRFRTPAVPGFFELRDHGELLLSGAAHFADPRE